jgi:hypothetical protein
VEELFELRQYIQHKQYGEALDLIGEMEEMSRADKVNKIYSFAKILLLHLIKQVAEKRTTRSWDLSIRNAVDGIGRTNQMRKAKGFYLNQMALQEAIHQAYSLALAGAALEVFEGRYDEAELGQLVDRMAIEQRALELIQSYHEE